MFVCTAGRSGSGAPSPSHSAHGTHTATEQLPPSWTALQRAGSVSSTWMRLSDSTVRARRSLLDACLRDVCVDVPHLLAHPKMLVFLGVTVGDLPAALQAGGAAAGKVARSGHAAVVEQAGEMFLGSYGVLSLLALCTMLLLTVRLLLNMKCMAACLVHNAAS